MNDPVNNFAQFQAMFIRGWSDSEEKTQKCRLVFTFNSVYMSVGGDSASTWRRKSVLNFIRYDIRQLDKQDIFGCSLNILSKSSLKVLSINNYKT